MYYFCEPRHVTPAPLQGNILKKKKFGGIFFMTQQKNLDKISQLTPAAARLLLAYVYANFGDSVDAIVQRSGIVDMETYRRAKAQLAEFGFLRVQEAMSVHQGGQHYQPERETLKSPYSATVNPTH
jgi:hypothetical protein